MFLEPQQNPWSFIWGTSPWSCSMICNIIIVFSNYNQINNSRVGSLIISRLHTNTSIVASHDLILFSVLYETWYFYLPSTPVWWPVMFSYGTVHDIIYLDTSINLWSSHDLILFYVWYRILFTLTPASICGPIIISYCSMFDTGYYLPWHQHKSVDLSWFHTVPHSAIDARHC